ncbi:hypothetical protein COV49_00230 [Candidatus Falkowbacteria bacterium CG11_big_fil_rev_8_21_14_0_20_39_10]|uniref:Uncharacterized protein n=1 Tax=Candidatus Falkowbacteria bacterium CG11_big_fil_rev_8_21_14_0_20_39_10 TaxID=1974570 RepID=A0A2M6KA72_9BACT|nr:MAG: hypothetical protein COV49_00230 [Candidatus Falkowbacteria bacterium CG11_big_fil_rev_8_21_14_0_20_39_10]
MKKLKWYDIGLYKLCVFSVALLIAVWWPALVSLDWYWYAIVFLLTLARLLYVMFKPNQVY